jgi:Predicted Zn-dependent hydrolases of the beta-lactamase fold
MYIQFLGTGAADCDLAHRCGAECRRFSSVLVDGALLIDPNPCVFESAETFGIPLDSVKYIINTHRHADHYDPETIAHLTQAGAEFIAFSAGELKQVGGYTVEAVRANHGTCEGAVHFIISDGDKKLFYGLDGAWLLYEEVAAIKRAGGVDLAVLDATVGDTEGDYRVFEHNNLRMVREISLSLRLFVRRFIISHIARTLHTGHAELVNRMRPDGIEVAYDGLLVEITNIK